MQEKREMERQERRPLACSGLPGGSSHLAGLWIPGGLKWHHKGGTSLIRILKPFLSLRLFAHLETGHSFGE